MPLTITWDDRVICTPGIMMLMGELHRFEQNGHSFVLSHRGWGFFGQFVLSMDGRELGGGAPEAIVSAPQHAPAAAQFVKELSCPESDEVVGEEEYPLDNRFGGSPFSTDRQVSKESTNELSVEVSKEVTGTLGVEIVSVIKAEVAAHVTRQTGYKIGEKVTESQTLHFTVAANQSVVYQVVWKRKVRSGEHLYLASGAPVTVPYRVNYGLSCEVRTEELRRSA